MTRAPRTAAAALVETLARHGVTRVFCVPGESYLAVLDALRDSDIETVVARQEGGAAMMAEADAKQTGLPGVVFVTRGPGAANASAGVHVAQQDSTPLVLFAGQVERAARGRDAFQEVDFQAFFGGMAKAVVEVADGEQLPTAVATAFETALRGRPGPVVVSLPEDMLTDPCAVPAAGPATIAAAEPGGAAMRRFDGLLDHAARPLVVVGGSVWDPDSVAALQSFAETAGVPVACVFRRQHLFDHLHGHYAGDIGIGVNPALREAVTDTDLLVLLGTRFSEIPSQSYALPRHETPVVHVHPDAKELGRVHRTVLAVHARPRQFLAATAARGDRTAYVRGLHESYLAWSALPDAADGPLTMRHVMAVLRDHAEPGMVVTNGAGNYSGWIHRFHRFRRFRTQIAPTSGTMGYGLPAAIASKLRDPARTVVCFAGDGCFQMTGQELGTAVQFGAAVVVLVVDNGMYGTIRMHQEREYPGREHATALANPDFAALARSYGCHAERVDENAGFAPAFERAKAVGRPALLHLVVDPEAITPTTTLTAIREGR